MPAPDTTVHVGDSRQFDITFTKDNAPADPTDVYLHLRKPSGEYVVLQEGADPEVERTAEGVYRGEYTLDEPGWWIWAWRGEGNVVLYEEQQLFVYPARAVAPAP